MAFSATNYELASKLFAEAYALDPSLTDARLYHGYAEMMLYIPGSTGAESTAHAETAMSVFLEALDSDPENKLAATLIASLYFNMKRFDEAIRAHERVIELDPGAADSHYTIGVIYWTRSYEPRLKARADLGMSPDMPGPIPHAEQRGRLALLIRPDIDAGLEHLRKALEINPEYADAMAYMNLLYRERADLAQSPADYEADIEQANQWVQSTLEVKKALAERQR